MTNSDADNTADHSFPTEALAGMCAVSKLLKKKSIKCFPFRRTKNLILT